MSERLLRGRLPGPATGLPRRPLSISESTASCNIRFSLRTMISGALSFKSLVKRLLRLITRRYKSFKSLVAKRPPSSWTIGRNSGGITGITFKIIHSGLLPLFLKASTTSRRRIALILFWPLVECNSLRNSSLKASRSRPRSNSCIASAPIPTLKAPLP